MTVISKTLALLDALTPADVQALTPFERRRFADLCRYLAAVADSRVDAPKSGVLADLHHNRAH